MDILGKDGPHRETALNSPYVLLDPSDYILTLYRLGRYETWLSSPRLPAPASMVPPQHRIPTAADILGTIGTVLWCIQLIPQIWQNWRRKSTEGVPPLMMILWAVCGPPFGVYVIVQNFNIPLQVQPQCFTFLTIVTWSDTRLREGMFSMESGGRRNRIGCFAGRD